MGADKALRQSRTAASWAAMALQDDPDLQSGFRVGAASNAMAGRPEQARKAVARLRQLNPGLRLWRPADVAVLCGGFQSGGIRSPRSKRRYFSAVQSR